MQGKVGKRDDKRQPLNIVTNARGKSWDVCRMGQKRRRTSQSVPVEQYLQCFVVEAHETVEKRQAGYSDSVLTILDTCENWSISEYSQDNCSVDDNDNTVACDTQSTRLLSGGDALRLEFLQFCIKYGIERRRMIFLGEIKSRSSQRER